MEVLASLNGTAHDVLRAKSIRDNPNGSVIHENRSSSRPNEERRYRSGHRVGVVPQNDPPEWCWRFTQLDGAIDCFYNGLVPRTQAVLGPHFRPVSAKSRNEPSNQPCSWMGVHGYLGST